MVEDPDAIWKPGYEAPPDDAESAAPRDREPGAVGAQRDGVRPGGGAPGGRSGPRRAPALAEPGPPVIEIRGGAPWQVEPAGGDPPPATGALGRRARPALALAAIVALAVVAAVVVVTTRSGDPAPRRPEPGELAGADERRLPTEVDLLWSTVLPGTGNALSSTVLVDGRNLVVAVVDDGSRNRSMIAGLDAMTGTPRWRRSFSFAPPEVSLLGVIDGVVVVEQRDAARRRLFGLAAVDGATLWERETLSASGNAVLLGTAVIANLSAAVDPLVTFIDPGTGETLGDAVGHALTTDLAGTWYFAWGNRIVAVDLADGWSEPVVVPADRTRSREVAVIDDRLFGTDPEGRVFELTADRGGERLDGADGLPVIGSMFPAGGSSFVALGDDLVFGSHVVGDRVRTTWTRSAALRSFGLTERGLVLVLADGEAVFGEGVELSVVDGVTGAQLAGIAGVDEAGDVPLIVGDGFITTVERVEGAARLGYDLDGTELWTLPVSGELRVGDGLIVVMDASPSGYRLRAYGSATG